MSALHREHRSIALETRHASEHLQEHILRHASHRRRGVGTRQALRLLLVVLSCAACATTPRARAVRAADEGAWEQAVNEYRQAVTEEPGDAALWRDLGLAHLRLNEVRQARDAFERAAQIEPTSAKLRILIGRTHELERHYDEALSSYRLATEIEPSNARAWRYAGARLLRWGEADAAEPLLARAVALDASHAESWNALALARAQQGDAQAAEETFRRGIRTHPEHRGMRAGLAAILINHRRLPEALRVYDAIVAKWPDFAAAHVGRALVLDALGRRREAEAAFADAARVDDDPAYAKRLHEYRAHLATQP